MSMESLVGKPKNVYPPVSTWAIYMEYWRGAKKHFVFGLITLLGMSGGNIILSVITPTYYKRFFDYLQSSIDANTTTELLVSTLVSILILNLVGWIMFRSSGFAMVQFEIRSMRDLRQNAYDYILGHSHNFFSNNFTGSLVQRINRYTRAFERLSDRILFDIIPLVIKVTGVIIVLNVLDRGLALAMTIWIVAFLIISFGFNKFKLKFDVQAAATDSKVAGVLSDSISNHNATQLFTAKSDESKYFKNVNEEFARIYNIRWNIGEASNAIQSLLNFGIEFYIFYYLIDNWSEGLVTIGTFALVQAYILSLSNSLWGFARIVRDLYEATADAREMVEILHFPHEIQDLPSAATLHVSKGRIDFKNVSFTFGKGKEASKPVFTNFNLSIKPGEKVAIIGSSGAGKSTFVKLLLRLHDIDSGEILIDNQDIKIVTQESLRRNISLVPQDPALFHRTLMENIRYGNREASDEEVVNASRLAHCDIFIKEFPNKYDTFVGERGIKLSGGERQRVAIARAILKNAPILVLDEATSSLDSHSESLIQDALNTLMKGKTTIVIAHRLSTIKKMDRIIVLGKDGVIEQGGHEELIRKQGTYAKLWNLQAGGFADKSIEDLLDQK